MNFLEVTVKYIRISCSMLKALVLEDLLAIFPESVCIGLQLIGLNI